MTGAAIGETLPFAIGIAISPIPIIAVILMLLSARARENGLAFAAGWCIGVFTLTLLVAVIADGAGADSDETVYDGVNWIKAILACVLLFMAWKQWQSRPRPGEEPSLPGWASAIDDFTPARSFGMAALLGSVNPKNLVLAGGAGATIGQAGLPAGSMLIAVAAFTAVASISTVGAVAYFFIAGERATRFLDEMRDWLGRNGATVMAVVLLVLGVVMLGDALSGLSL